MGESDKIPTSGNTGRKWGTRLCGTSLVWGTLCSVCFVTYFPLIRSMNSFRKRGASEARQTFAFGFSSITPSIS